MKRFIGLCFLVIISTVYGEERLTITAGDGLELAIDYFQPSKPLDKAVLMLHQCNSQRKMYQNLGELLASKGIHALSMDFRGFAESSNAEFDVSVIGTLPKEQRSAGYKAILKYWPDDVISAYQLLKQKAGKNAKVGVIGASCGGTQGLLLTEKYPVHAIGFFSSAQKDKNINLYADVAAEKPTLIIAAEDDGDTFVSANQLFTAAKHPNSQLLSYKGAEHGFPLFKRDPQLAEIIANWYKIQLQ